MAEPESEEQLLGRLHGAASGDAALNQLRHRYDLLRGDYEALVARLADLEQRLQTEHPTAPAPPPPSLRDQVRAPLLRLREEYREAIEELLGLVDGLDQVIGGRMKGQRGSEREGDTPLHTVRIAAAGVGPGEALDFQERIAALPGVARVTMEAVDRDRASFTVELDREGQ